MGNWTEATSNLFRVRFDDDARAEVEEMVHVLEVVAARLEAHGLVLPPHPTVVVHPSPWSLALAQPAYALVASRTESLGRRYLATWCSGAILHVVSPVRLLRGADKQVHGRDALERVPSVGLAHLALGHANPGLSLQRAALSRRRWLWLAWGAGQSLVGQVPLLASSIAARRRERRQLDILPSMRDAPVLGGSVVELVLRQRGLTGLVQLLREPLPESPAAWLSRALPGLGSTERDVRWRMLLDEIDAARSKALAEASARAIADAEAARAEQERLDRAMADARRAQAAAEERSGEGGAAS